MSQEEKELLLKDLCARLTYGVKILHTGWDCDGDTDFDTIETLIGIDDRFIYTVWDKTGDREKHCLSVSNWKPYLRPMSSMTEEEKRELSAKYNWSIRGNDISIRYHSEGYWDDDTECPTDEYLKLFDWLNAHHFDYRGLIPMGLAIAVTEENTPYKE